MNVYQYPENKDDLPKYRVAVMQAALEGKPVQFAYTHIDPNSWCEHGPGGKPSWDWACIRYRIRPEPAYKPWTAETFRWPDCLRRRNVGLGAGLPFAVIAVAPSHVVVPDPNAPSSGFCYCFTWQGLLDHCEASYDRGATWQRCGEEVRL